MSIMVVYVLLLVVGVVVTFAADNFQNDVHTWNATRNFITDREYIVANVSHESVTAHAKEVTNLKDICIQLNISIPMCSCQLTPELCSFESFVQGVLNRTRTRRYTRSKTYTQVYATETILASCFGILGNAAVILVAYKQRRSLPLLQTTHSGASTFKFRVLFVPDHQCCTPVLDQSVDLFIPDV